MLCPMGAKKHTGSQPDAKPQFAARLAQVRLHAGHKHKKSFAGAIGVEDETYNRWERGETEPGIAVLTRIHQLTGVSLDYLVAGNLNSLGSSDGGRVSRPFRKRA